MAISRFSTSRVGAGLPKYQKLWDQSTVYVPPTFESIATVSVDSGGASSITFSSIPSTYKHLQIRILGRDSAGEGTFNLQLNSDTTLSNYRRHYMYSTGSGTPVTGTNSTNRTYTINNIPYNAVASGVFGVAVIDLVDYSSNSKYKTIRALGGYHGGSNRVVMANSNLWLNTSAVTSITLNVDTGNNWAQYTHAALYGIRG